MVGRRLWLCYPMLNFNKLIFKWCNNNNNKLRRKKLWRRGLEESDKKIIQILGHPRKKSWEKNYKWFNKTYRLRKVELDLSALLILWWVCKCKSWTQLWACNQIKPSHLCLMQLEHHSLLIICLMQILIEHRQIVLQVME